MKLTLPNGCSKYGSQMGRRNTFPEDTNKAIKLRMEKLRWVDGDYDKWGAYWGGSNKDNIFCAWNDEKGVFVFVRSGDRATAKQLVCNILPNATFFR